MVPLPAYYGVIGGVRGEGGETKKKNTKETGIAR